MQIAVIEYSRDVANIPDANSGEFDEQCKNRVIDFMPGQSEDIDKGGTLRLGAYPCVIESGTTMERCYGTQLINALRKLCMQMLKADTSVKDSLAGKRQRCAWSFDYAISVAVGYALASPVS